MPITRFQVRNEYGLATRELYRESVDKEDPKGVLDGVAVAGLVGLLRQLGDLADFAAEVFHNLQEQVMITSYRSRKLVTRVKHIEAALPPLEKIILTQTSHIHFAYTPGSEWHPRIRNEQNHFIYNDLPRCIMDSYEECKEPPRLQLLDRFDTGGPGSCLKRYSDPTFFRRTSGNSTLNTLKSQKERKSHKIKKRRSKKQGSQFSQDASNFDSGSRMHSSAPSHHHQSSPTQTVTTLDMTFKSGVVDRSDSLGSGDGLGFIECVFHPTTSTKPSEANIVRSSSGSNEKTSSMCELNHTDELTAAVEAKKLESSNSETTARSPLSVTWDEKMEVLEPMVLETELTEVPQVNNTIFELPEPEISPIIPSSVDNGILKMPEGSFVRDEPHLQPIDWDSGSDGSPKLHATNLEEDDDKLDPVPPQEYINWNSGRVECPKMHEISPEEGAKLVPQSPYLERIDWDSGSEESPKMHTTSVEEDGAKLDPLGVHDNKFDCSDTNIQSSGQTSRRNETPAVIVRNFQLFEKTEPVFGGSTNGNGKYLEDQLEENGSETDNFVDALNTIESESETDADCQTKTEIELCSVPKVDSKDDIVSEQIAQNINENSLLCRSPSTSCNTLDPSCLMGFQDLTSSDCPPLEESLQRATSTCNYSAGNASLSPVDSNLSVHSVEYTAQQDPHPRPALDESLCEVPSSCDDFGEIVCLNLNPTDSISSMNAQRNPSCTHSFLKECLPGVPSSCNDSGREVCLNPNEVISSVHAVDDTTSQDLATLPAREESLQKEEGCSKPSVSTSSAYSSDSLGLQGTQSSSMQIHSSENNPSVSNDVSRTESSVGESLSESKVASVLDPLDEAVHYSPYVSSQLPVGSSAVAVSTLWTNGGLLGLQPSKPPDFGTSNTNTIKLSDASLGNNNLEDDKSSLTGEHPSQHSKSDLDGEQVEWTNIHQHNTLGHSQASVQHTANLIPPDTKDPVASDAKLAPNEAVHVDEERSPSSGLVMHGSERTRSTSHNERPDAVGSQKGYPLQHSLSGSNSEELTSCIDSPPPSPPLELMRISFQPINKFETSKLKLKYPEGIDHQDEFTDAFPSFQLVPEPANLHHGVDLDSDDDTFCRSNPCISDDDFGHLSDSNSEFWESGDSSESRGPMAYNSLQRVSSEESISSYPELEASVNRSLDVNSGPFKTVDERVEELASLGPLSGIPVLNNMNPLYQEAKISSDLKELVDSFSLRDLTPEPPPLPPLQWRITRSQSDMVAGMGGLANILRQFPDSVHQGSALSLDQESAEDKSVNKAEKLFATASTRLLDGEKKRLNAREKANQAAKLRRVDEKEDFLQQIRTQSFNLRKTGAGRPAYTPPAPPTNVKVTAILEKAKTIRQAVASDEGEDAWSDT